MAIEILKWRRLEKNTLQGFVSILMPSMGLEIRDITVHRKGNDRWLGMPARPYDDNGTTKYAYILKFQDKKIWDRFQSETLDALDEYVRDHDQTTSPMENDSIPF